MFWFRIAVAYIGHKGISYKTLGKRFTKQAKTHVLPIATPVLREFHTKFPCSLWLAGKTGIFACFWFFRREFCMKFPCSRIIDNNNGKNFEKYCFFVYSMPIYYLMRQIEWSSRHIEIRIFYHLNCHFNWYDVIISLQDVFFEILHSKCSYQNVTSKRFL